MKLKSIAAAVALVAALPAFAGGPLGTLGTSFVGGNVSGTPWTDGYSFSLASAGDLWGQTVATSGITSYAVTLYDSTLSVIGSDSTAASFSFTGLSAGSYFLTYVGVGTGSYGVPLVPFQLYNIDDGTGEIAVLARTARSAPAKGARVQVKGTVGEVASLGNRSVGLHIEEQSRKSEY